MPVKKTDAFFKAWRNELMKSWVVVLVEKWGW